MSNAKYRPQETPQPGAAAVNIYDAQMRCQRDVKLFALYLELGGGMIDTRLQQHQRAVEGGIQSLKIGLASDRDEWARHEKDPQYKPRRFRPQVSVTEGLRSARGLMESLEARRELMAHTVEVARQGHQPQEQSLVAARAAFEACRLGKTNMPLGCELEADATAQVASPSGAPPTIGTSALVSMPSAGKTASATEKAGAVVPTQAAAA